MFAGSAATSSTTAASPSCTSSRSRRAPARRPRACRRSPARRSRSGRRGCGQKGDAALASHLQAQVGRDVELLVERERLGRTPGFAEMTLADRAPVGRVLRARVTGSSGRRLQGEPLVPTCAA